VDYAAVILAGGGARRLGGVDKPALPVAGVPMLARVLQAVDDAATRVVVGPPDLPVPPDQAVVVREEPPGGGPVAALAAAFSLAPPQVGLTAILAGDLPLLTSEAIGRLRGAAAGYDGAVFADDEDREQWLCGVWHTTTIAAALGSAPSPGRSLRSLLRPLSYVRVHDDTRMPAWFDCDSYDDIKRAEEWLTR
jgi:molybdenum cofactor guanylyltransferase